MAGRETTTVGSMVGTEERGRLWAIRTALRKQITQKTAAAMRGLSERQIRRLVKVVREKGETGIVHALRGRPSNRRLPDEVKRKALSLYRERYSAFGLTVAAVKLFECEGIKISGETLRRWLIDAGYRQNRRKKQNSRGLLAMQETLWRDDSGNRISY